MQTFLEFEKPIAELEGKIEELRHLTDTGDINIADEVSKLQVKVDRLLRQTYAKLAPAQKEGRGAVALDGKLIDFASIRQAEVMVKKAEQIASL